jgi:hypothetical protein
MRRNPGFDGKVGHKIEDGVVTELRIVTDQVTDIAPIRAFNALRVIDCSGTTTTNLNTNGLLADLTPLKAMNLAGLRHLNLSNTQVSDAGLAHFKDCKDLVDLHLARTQVSDAGLAHFKDCDSLKRLFLQQTTAWQTGRGAGAGRQCPLESAQPGFRRQGRAHHRRRRGDRTAIPHG